MNKLIVCLLTVVMSFSASAFAVASEHEQERVKEAGEVLKEILNIPDDIPQDLLDKAECVVVLPSVKKGAFGIGGSYGRGSVSAHWIDSDCTLTVIINCWRRCRAASFPN